MEGTIINNQLKSFQLVESEGSVIFFNGSYYEDPSIDELKEIKKLIDSTINNYEYISLDIQKSNNIIKEERFKEFEDIFIPKKTKKTKKGIIYIMKCGRTNLYKIGLTTGSVDTRFNSLKTANPSINLFKYYEEVIDLYNKEKELHNLFSKKRIDGEWFELNESDLCEIDLFFNVVPF